MKAMLVETAGGADAMRWNEVETPSPGPGEVLIRHTRIGINFIDVYYRSGLYAWPSDRIIPGAEGVGMVETVGAGVSEFAAGDRVCYVDRLGAYCEKRTIAADKLVKLPDAIADEIAAACLLKGLTVHYLVNASYAVKAGDVVLVHAAAGGVGLILGQWLKALGAIAIGTAGSAEKVELAKANGYAHVVNYRSDDFVETVMEVTSGEGCAAVYDSVGADTWRRSLKSLRKRGMFVSFGQSSGMITDFKFSDLAAHGSLSANRPVLFDYIDKRPELLQRAEDLFRMIETGLVTIQPPELHPLADAALAHSRLEARQTTGSLVLTA